MDCAPNPSLMRGKSLKKQIRKLRHDSLLQILAAGIGVYCLLTASGSSEPVAILGCLDCLNSSKIKTFRSKGSFKLNPHHANGFCLLKTVPSMQRSHASGCLHSLCIMQPLLNAIPRDGDACDQHFGNGCVRLHQFSLFP